MHSGGRPALGTLSVSANAEHPGVLDVAGEIDVATAPLLLEAVLGAATSAPPGGAVVVDLADVDFVGCSALNALVAARRQLRACDIDVAVRSPTRLFTVMADLFGLADLIEAPRAGDLRR